jgi:acyl carrier protein
MSADSWNSVVDVKVQGCWNLHNALRKRGEAGLDFFMLTSSVSGSVGAIAQSNYCSANHFLDMFARYRRSLGLPAISVALGMINDIGYLSEKPDVESKLARSGLSSLNEKEVLLVVEEALSSSTVFGDGGDLFNDFASAHLLTGIEHAAQYHDTTARSSSSSPFARDPRVRGLIAADSSISSSTSSLNTNEVGSEAGVFRDDDEMLLHDMLDAIRSPLSSSQASPVVNKEVIYEAIQSHFKRALARILSISDVDSVDTQKSLIEYGIDSMIATEIRTWLFCSFQMNVSVFQILAKGTTIKQLVEIVSKEVDKVLG